MIRDTCTTPSFLVRGWCGFFRTLPDITEGMTVFSLFSASTQGLAFILSRLEIDDSELTSHPIPIVSWNRSEVLTPIPNPAKVRRTPPGKYRTTVSMTEFQDAVTDWNRVAW